jgi:hypothetical protein
MSYNIDLSCGCVVYVSTHPSSGVAHTRIIETRGRGCAVRRHQVGLRLSLWELLPEPPRQSGVEWIDGEVAAARI